MGSGARKDVYLIPEPPLTNFKLLSPHPQSNGMMALALILWGVVKWAPYKDSAP